MSRKGYLVPDELWPLILQFTPAQATDQDVRDCLRDYNDVTAFMDLQERIRKIAEAA